MKRLVFAILAFFALSNFAFASNVNFATISKADTQFLFKDKSVKVLALNENELKETQGAWVGFAFRWIFTATRVYWKTWRTGGKIYSKGWHGPHHNFGTRKRPSWRKHYQWNTSHGTYRVPYGRHYLYKNRPDLGYRSWWSIFRR